MVVYRFDNSKIQMVENGKVKKNVYFRLLLLTLGFDFIFNNK